MSTGMLVMAEACLKNAMDLSGLLLLYSSLGNAEGIVELASLAKENGKNNVAFLCLFMLGKLEECLQLLTDSNRIPEAALMARSYLPSKVSEIVAIWRKDLNKATMTGTKSMKGTPYLMAPEVILQTRHSFSADIWSVGCTVIEMATGKPPWSQQYQEVATLFHIWTTKSQPPIPDPFSVGAKDFLLKYLQKEPNFRAAAAVLLQPSSSTPLFLHLALHSSES